MTAPADFISLALPDFISLALPDFPREFYMDPAWAPPGGWSAGCSHEPQALTTAHPALVMIVFCQTTNYDTFCDSSLVNNIFQVL